MALSVIGAVIGPPGSEVALGPGSGPGSKEVAWQGAPLQAALDAALKSSALPANSPDRALAGALAYGYCRLERRMQGLLDLFCRHRRGLPPLLQRLMTLAALEIATFERVPAYASVNWAVSVARTMWGGRLAGVANAVLRELARLGPEVNNPDVLRRAIPDERRFLGVWHSQPDWLIDYFFATSPEDHVLAWLNAFSSSPPAGFRINLARLPGFKEPAGHAGELPTVSSPAWATAVGEAGATDGPGARSAASLTYAGQRGTPEDAVRELARQATARAGAALAFAPGTVPEAVAGWRPDELLAAGYVSRQGFGAQEALAWADGAGAFDKATIWDACAGRGGKSAMLLEAGHKVRLSTDPDAGRLAGLPGEAARLGLALPLCARMDAAHPALRPDRPGGGRLAILADAPCSGLGTLARRPDIKYHRRPADLVALARLGRRIGAGLAGVLRGGERLVWLTCTLNPAENEEAAAAIARDNGLRLESAFTTPVASPGHEFFYGAILVKQ